MILKTIVRTQSELRISHTDKVLFLGSCFATNIASKAAYYGFDVYNPFGAIYNPASVLKCLNILKCNNFVTSDKLIYERGLFCSYDFHSAYSRATADDALKAMNAEIERGHNYLDSAKFIIITLGTAHAYTLTGTGEIVANCHHTDAKCFTRRLLSIDEIADNIGGFVKEFPDKEFIFTVSPIRYAKDGFHNSRLSKATLLLAIDKICNSHKNCSYFPSYEIMEDELRDYRFYAADMIHPSDLAVDYIWEQFADTYFTEETKGKCKEFEKARKLENHRPHHPINK